MLPTDRAHTFSGAPLDDLLSVLLRQLKRPLGTQGFKLTDSEAHRLAHERAQGHTPDRSAQLVAALQGTVQESQAVLAQWGLTFQTALTADLSTLGGWQTTAEFLDIANEKVPPRRRGRCPATMSQPPSCIPDPRVTCPQAAMPPRSFGGKGLRVLEVVHARSKNNEFAP